MPILPPALASTSTRVVLSQRKVPSSSGPSVGMTYALARRLSSNAGMTIARGALDDLPHLVRQHRQRNLAAMRSATSQSLGEFAGLLQADLWRHRRLVGIHDRLDDGRAGFGQCPVQDLAAACRIGD